MIKITLCFIVATTFIFSNHAHGESTDKCGLLVNTLLKVDPAKQGASIENFYFTQENFCDESTEEPLSNIEIQLLDKNGKALQNKSIFIPGHTIAESSVSKNEMILGNTQFAQDLQFRTFKFAMTESMKSNPPVSYKIISKNDQKVMGMGEVK
jgi:hypothetical protein